MYPRDISVELINNALSLSMLAPDYRLYGSRLFGPWLSALGFLFPLALGTRLYRLLALLLSALFGFRYYGSSSLMLLERLDYTRSLRFTADARKIPATVSTAETGSFPALAASTDSSLASPHHNFLSPGPRIFPLLISLAVTRY